MGWRSTVGLAALLLLALGIAYYDVRAGHPEVSWRALLSLPKPASPADEVHHLLEFDPATVEAIHLRRGNDDVVVRRDGATWHGVARPEIFDDLLVNLLEMAEILHLEVAPEELRDLGLDPPQGLIELRRGAAAPIVVRLGIRNPPATGVYAQLGDGGRVVLTGALVLWELEKAVKAAAPQAE